MRIAIILDPLDGIKTYKDSTYAMMVEASARGHALAVCEQGELALEAGRVVARSRPLELLDTTGRPHDWYRLGDETVEPLEAFDAVLMRKDPPFDMEYVYSTYLLEHAARRGARVFNHPRAVRDPRSWRSWSSRSSPRPRSSPATPRGCAPSSSSRGRRSSSCSTEWAARRSSGPATATRTCR